LRCLVSLRLIRLLQGRALAALHHRIPMHERRFLAWDTVLCLASAHLHRQSQVTLTFRRARNSSMPPWPAISPP